VALRRGISMKTFDPTWAVSIERLITKTRRDRTRVIRPVSPRLVVRANPLAARSPHSKIKSKPKKR
jgi:hypothetical protein